MYAFVRRRGHSPEDAEDLIQGFLAHLLRKDFLNGVGPEKGRFRSFLLACLKHYLADERAKAYAAKRGGGHPHLLLDLDEAEQRYRLGAGLEADPESLYERRWALDVLEHALNELRREATVAGTVAVFDQLQDSVFGEQRTETYGQLGSRLGLSETAVKVTVHRLRQRYRELVRDQIAQTVADPDEIELSSCCSSGRTPRRRP